VAGFWTHCVGKQVADNTPCNTLASKGRRQWRGCQPYRGRAASVINTGELVEAQLVRVLCGRPAHHHTLHRHAPHHYHTTSPCLIEAQCLCSVYYVHCVAHALPQQAASSAAVDLTPRQHSEYVALFQRRRVHSRVAAACSGAHRTHRLIPIAATLHVAVE